MSQFSRPVADRLLAVVRDLSFCRAVAEVMHIVQREARYLSEADGVTFVLREGDECHYAEENAIAPLWKGRRFPMNACVSGWVMLHGESVVIDDIYADARVPADAYRPTFVKSLAIVPVRTQDPVAAIGAYWATNHRASDDEVAVLQALADASALALENVRLYSILQSALQRAEALNRAKDEWISVLSHELRTPLTPILGWTRMLRTQSFDAERQGHALEVIERNVMAEIRIVDDLLDVSRMMAGRAGIERRHLDVRTVTQAAVDKVRDAATGKPVELFVTVPEDAIRVEGDANRLERALDNLLTNAIKYTASGGLVSVRVNRTDGQAVITVEDSGAGISPEVLPRIFDRFERGDSSVRRREGGLGIGLFMVRRIVELHGGSVTAHSDGPGHGSTFVIRLPLVPGRSAAARPEVVSADVPTLSGLRLLVVDDDRDTLDLLQHCLEGAGAQVASTSSVAQALSACANGTSFDAVISDLAMPHEDGFELLARIRTMSAPLASVPVIALTAHASEEDGRRALECGFQRYLSKPIDPTALAGAVAAVVPPAISAPRKH